MITEQLGNTVVNAVTKQPIPLAMQRLDVAGRATPAGAYLRVTHQFKCELSKPLEAIYVFQLPSSGTLRRFIVRGDGFEVESKLTPREDARKEYEQGVEDGHLSVLAETTLDGMVTLSVGQVKPDELITVVLDMVVGVESADQKYRFRFPFTLAPNYHSKAKVVPGSVEVPADVFGDLVLPEWKTTPDGLHQVAFKLLVEPGGLLDSVSSPSHRILVRPWTDGRAEVELAGGSDIPNKDLVLDVVSKEAAPMVLADDVLVTGKTDKDDPNLPVEAPRWSILTPSSVFPRAASISRRVCFVVDTSGSMGGQRIDSAKLALNTCLAGLDPADEFGLVAFSFSPNAYDKGVGKATQTNRAAAAKWIGVLQAGGGTELSSALGAAVEVLGGPGHDMFLITDGEVMETGPIIEQCAACGTRIHILGLGEAAQSRFLEGLARRTGGVSEMVGVREDVAAKALALFNAVRQPVQNDVTAVVTMQDGTTQTHEVEVIYQNRPVILTDDAKTKGLPASVEYTFGLGKASVDLTNPRTVQNGLIALLYAGRMVEDNESALDMLKDGPGKVAVNQELRDISTKYGLASRAMSLCAVVKRFGDKAGETPDQKVVPVGLPEDMPLEALGSGVGVRGSALRNSPQALNASYQGSFRSLFSGVSYAFAPPATYGMTGGGGGYSSSNSTHWTNASNPTKSASSTSLRDRLTLRSVRRVSAAPVEIEEVTLCCDEGQNDTRGIGFGDNIETLVSVAPSQSNPSLMLELGQIGDDGGLYVGLPMQIRLYLTLFLALALLKKDAESGQSVYGVHLRKMVSFLGNNLPSLPQSVLDKIRGGSVKVEGDWENMYWDTRKSNTIPAEPFLTTLS